MTLEIDCHLSLSLFFSNLGYLMIEIKSTPTKRIIIIVFFYLDDFFHHVQRSLNVGVNFRIET